MKKVKPKEQINFIQVFYKKKLKGTVIIKCIPEELTRTKMKNSVGYIVCPSLAQFCNYKVITNLTKLPIGLADTIIKHYEYKIKTLNQELKDIKTRMKL